MAKLSFDEADLSNSNIDDLGPFEKDVLNDWYVKFRDYKNYPIVGRVSAPPAVKDFTKEELIQFKECAEVPAGRVDAPIYMAISGKVIDVSYGGKEMYGKGGPYFLFAGIDASRALAKMSFKPEDLNNSDLSDLTEEQQKTLSEWEHKFINVRKYPIVGKLVN
jgi:membrane-associated progesterone receptor component